MLGGYKQSGPHRHQTASKARRQQGLLSSAASQRAHAWSRGARERGALRALGRPAGAQSGGWGERSARTARWVRPAQESVGRARAPARKPRDLEARLRVEAGETGGARTRRAEGAGERTGAQDCARRESARPRASPLSRVEAGEAGGARTRRAGLCIEAGEAGSGRGGGGVSEAYQEYRLG